MLLKIARAHPPDRERTPKRNRRAPRTETHPQKFDRTALSNPRSAKESPRIARCAHRIANRDSCTRRCSLQDARTKEAYRDAGKHRALQTADLRDPVPAPAEFPAVAPSSSGSGV